jgi:putative tryptophan/tyrosine transport system substrate-binding protein
MKRREFITLLGGAAAAWPLAARAQQSAMPVIGFLGSASSDLYSKALGAFRQGLGETGYVEGRNVMIEYRWASGQYDQLPALAADLVRHHVSVLVAPGSTPAALAAKAATAMIPIVFQLGTDPVAAGLVPRLDRPGGNVTGVTNINTELAPKRLELLRELIPTAKLIAVLVNPTSAFITENISKDLQSTARTLGLQLEILSASNESDFDKVFATLAQLRADALVIAPDAMFISRSEELGALTLRHRVPAITQYREFAVAGGFYGGNSTEAVRLLGIYTGKVLKGEKPADLPVVQSAKVELVINVKTAKALGIAIPNTLIGRADEVIE